MKTILAITAALATGCTDSVKCADGTHSKGGNCYPYDPNDKTPPITTASPAGGRSRNPVPDFVTLTTNEPATIYYTTDGSEPDKTKGGELSPVVVPGVASGTTLKFFAIDLAGNQEMTNTVDYVSDTTAPDPVSNLSVRVAGTTATLAWTNPTASDFKGTIVARIGDVVDANPTPGMIYGSPSSLSSSVNMIQIGTQTTAAQTGIAHGVVRYAVWSYDDLGNYSTPAVVQTDVGPLASNAVFTFNTGTSALTKTSPADFDVSATTAQLNTTTVTLSLSVKNLTTSYLQNPKAEVTSVTNATYSGANGTADGYAFQSMGANTLAPGATATSTLTFINATGTVTMNVSVGHHPGILGAARPTSSATTRAVAELGGGLAYNSSVMSMTGPNAGRTGGAGRPGVVVGGRYLDLANSHGLERWDLTTQMFVTGVNLGQTGRSQILDIRASHGREYALVKNGGRRRGGTMVLVVLDEGLHVTTTIPLAVSCSHGMVSSAMSIDGNMLAVPGDNGVELIDLVHLTPYDADPTTPQLDIISPKFPTGRIRSVAFFNGTQGLIATLFSTDQPNVAVVKLSTSGYTTALSSVGGGRSQQVLTGPDGRVWIATETGLAVYDPSTDAITNSSHSGGALGLTNSGGGLWALRTDRRTVDLLDSNGAATRAVTLPQSVYGHWLQSTDEP
jgi:hypothetical protein